jgi:hypothetical protein
MGVRDMPSFCTMASSAMRSAPGNSPDRIISRRLNCAFTACEVLISAAGADTAGAARRWTAGDFTRDREMGSGCIVREN